MPNYLSSVSNMFIVIFQGPLMFTFIDVHVRAAYRGWMVRDQLITLDHQNAN